MEANEQHVMDVWDWVQIRLAEPFEGVAEGKWIVRLPLLPFSQIGFDSKSKAVQAAYDFTIAREEQIQRRENCLVLLSCCDTEELNDQGLTDWNSIIAREQAALDELRKGMRQ